MLLIAVADIVDVSIAIGHAVLRVAIGINVAKMLMRVTELLMM